MIEKLKQIFLLFNFQNKLEVITGGNASTMELELFNGDTLVTKLQNNDDLLGSYPILDGMRIHVTDQFTFLAENVEKFNLSDEQYSQKRNTVRSFLQQNKLGKYNEEEQRKMQERLDEEIKEAEALAAEAKIGSRCLITAKGPRRIGTIMYNGRLEGKSGIFIGVKLDEPLGLNDGFVNGKRYFECQPKYGSMVPVTNITVGDYPPVEYDLDEEI